MKARKNCPICGIENTGGIVHAYHKRAAKRSGYTLEALSGMIAYDSEMRALIEIVGDAVDRARIADDWTPKDIQKAKTWWHHSDLRRLESKRKKALRRKAIRTAKRNAKPLVRELCHAVDIGRLTAHW